MVPISAVPAAALMKSHFKSNLACKHPILFSVKIPEVLSFYYYDYSAKKSCPHLRASTTCGQTFGAVIIL